MAHLYFNGAMRVFAFHLCRHHQSALTDGEAGRVVLSYARGKREQDAVKG